MTPFTLYGILERNVSAAITFKAEKRASILTPSPLKTVVNLTKRNHVTYSYSVFFTNVTVR
jgi:hypothetical protein